MPIACRLFALPPEAADLVLDDPARLPAALAAAQRYTTVYRYWHAIDYLLSQELPDDASVSLLQLGRSVSAAEGEIPGARLLRPAEVRQLSGALDRIEPETLAPHYEAAVLDAAGIYPRAWLEWEEEFDPLGYILEHYSFLQYFARQCAAAGDALVFHYEFRRDETDD
jgi:hypothetical protein